MKRAWLSTRSSPDAISARTISSNRPACAVSMRMVTSILSDVSSAMTLPLVANRHSCGRHSCCRHSCPASLRTSDTKHLPPPAGACHHHLVGRQQEPLADIARRMRERSRDLQKALPQGATPELYIGLGDQGG